MKNLIYILFISLSVAPIVHAGNDPRSTQPSELNLPTGLPPVPAPAVPVVAPPAPPVPTMGVVEGVATTMGIAIAFGGMMFVGFQLALAM